MATHPDKSLEEKIDAAVDLMEKGQCADGYLNSHFSLVEPEKRWTHVKDLHEPYCAGHLMEGAVAYYQAGKTPRKSVAFKAIPYAVWANRKPGEMKVWIRDDGF